MSHHWNAIVKSKMLCTVYGIFVCIIDKLVKFGLLLCSRRISADRTTTTTVIGHSHSILAWQRSRVIKIVNRVVVTICKHVVADDVLTGAYKFIRIDESADLGIVISALQVIQARLAIPV